MSPARSATRRSAFWRGRGGVRTSRKPDRDFLLDRYLAPQPRVALAAAMAAYAHGGMDVSDGFVGDLTKMLAVSGVSARVRVYRLPLSLAARAAIAANPDLFAVAATGGDDYEIIASVAPDSAPAFEAAAARRRACRSRCVGEAVEGHAEPRFVGPDGGLVTFARRSYSHF